MDYTQETLSVLGLIYSALIEILINANLLLIILSILPAVILLWYFDKQDVGRKEPRRLKWKIFRWGLLATLFAFLIEIAVDGVWLSYFDPYSWIYIFLTSFITAGLVEEALKLWVVKTHIYENKHFNEIMDGISYTIIASMGFATMENILYVVQGGYIVAIIRALLAVPAHALFSGIMGYYIGKSRFIPEKRLRTKTIYKGLILAIFYHGLYDFLLLSGNIIMIILVVPLMIVMGMHLLVKIREARFEDKIDKIKPRAFTLWKALKVFIGIFLMIMSVLSVIGIFIFMNNPDPDFTIREIDMAVNITVFASLIFFLVGLVMVWRRNK